MTEHQTYEHQIHPVKDHIAKNAHINNEQYLALYQQSIEQPEIFWAEQADKFLDWQKPWDKVLEYDYPKGEIKWFEGGQLNVSVNCLDRHLATRGDQVALIWEGDDPANDKKMTYCELHQEVCRFANVLKVHGVKKGDRVCIYLPMIIESAVVILACTRIGAVHSIVFGGFSAEALKDRVNDSDCKLVVCADEGYRGGKIIPIKATVDKAIASCPSIESVIVIKNSGNIVAWNDACDIWYHQAMSEVSAECEPEWMDAEDPLFILYTSGSTGQPKGLLHTTGGYLLYAAMTHKYIFDYQEGEIYWCTADIGWITGHTYMIYGPLCNGATTLLFEGVPTYPDASRFWQVVDKHQVNIFYTAPTALRALMAQGDQYLENTSRSSLRVLGSVGEPINPEAWEWYYELVGKENCPIVDTWWQTETGGILITPLPGATELIPSSATRPFFGVKPAILSNKGQVIEDDTEGVLVMERPWPGQARSIYGDHQRFIDTYFKNYPGYYFTGDGARRDERGYYWITGRVDDVINVSGHRMGTAEVESAIDEHPLVAETAVVGYPHAIKGQGIYAYVTLHVGIEGTEELKKELVKLVRADIGPIASPDLIQWSAQLPKTRSGKIMRRILRKIAANEVDTLGDTSTLADPDVVQSIIDNRLNR
ncbi:acetate--CoA ligase [methanotrophic endosymbiont of Bathymodiolus puteoserpentis (Logatchev)]|jgi:acetyl-CoA synthetase|uniref:acetate--CoA ligase n=1 Tax=methanotrophic endosymbiont of Bathymodiolus puteoserpentis (Logatchev) TaxID=343235 RepID=UPI0013C70C47|nr:acetate--CoA ligase [methanotrophic endosymbiont of Bathymodiolus puteoserpentis (Logatchev)]SHE20436.1 Acetyl-coenzyme A synthetase [methanotrophic endosymbiont of Bathymodiolus puteoserpentis (Logatchev)]